MRFFIVVLFLLFRMISLSQEKVIWTNVYNQKTKSIEMTAAISEGWHLYSQFVNNEIGPVPTSFKFTENEFVTLSGNVNEPKPIQEYDENFEATLNFFKEKVMFTQKVVAKQTTVEEIIITYMVCNATMCLPPVDQKFTVEIKSN